MGVKVEELRRKKQNMQDMQMILMTSIESNLTKVNTTAGGIRNTKKEMISSLQEQTKSVYYSSFYY